MRISVFAFCGGLALCAVLMGGCDVSTPSQVKTGDMRLTEDMKTHSLNASGPEAAQVNVIADDYRRAGRSRPMLLVTYAEGDKKAEAAAKRTANNYVRAFAAYGIRDMRVDYIGVEDKSRQGMALLSYTAVAALPPADCQRLTGYQGAEGLQEVKGYAFGCENKTYISKMVSNPDDLLGRAGAPDDDSRRQGTVIEKYKSGTPNERMEGINASEIGGGG